MTLMTLRSSGEGLPLLLLHAFPLDHRMWREAASAVPAARTVLARDIPDDLVDGEPSLELAADALADELAEAGIDRVVVAGLSMGGYVALALLERHPELVAGLGLLDTKAVADTSEAAARRRQVAERVEAAGDVSAVRPMVDDLLGETTKAARPQVVEQVQEWIGAQRPAAVAWCQRAMAARPDRTDALRAFTGPVLLAAGDEDTLTGPEVAADLATTAADAQLAIVPHVGHLSAVEDPETIGTLLAELAHRADPR